MPTASEPWGDGPPELGPLVVCLCGSTRYKEAFEAANRAETLAGRIVLTVGFFGKREATQPSEEVKRALDELHLQKVEMADEILVLDVDGYIGESTSHEIAHARLMGKRVRYLSLEEQPRKSKEGA